MFNKLARNPYFIFLPFLLLYAFVILINKWPTLYGDEIRYADFAWRLLHGYYSPPAPHIDLWNGPGYPLTIVPFMALKIHALTITLMNALYQYLAVVFLYKALSLITSHKMALLFTLPLAIYPNALSILPILYTEAFTCFLVSSFIYSITLNYTRGRMKYAIIAGPGTGVSYFNQNHFWLCTDHRPACMPADATVQKEPAASYTYPSKYY